MSDAVGQRYAKALFDIAQETKSLDKVEASMNGLQASLDESADLSEFVNSPLYSREVQQNTITAIAKKAKLDKLSTNTLALMAQKNRLAEVPAMMRAFDALLSEARGEVNAEVISAKALTKAQETKIAKTLKDKIGKDVTLNTQVDPSLLGGLVVKMGSIMIDSSLKGKLSKLQNVMKEVG